jgi:carotenoid cleavage dioxygenase
MMEPYLTYLRVSADGRLEQVENITVGGPTMMHDFNITRYHVIFMDLPAVFDLELAMRGEMPIRWSEEYPARLGVMPRNGNDTAVTWYQIDPCYVFHPMNAYDDGDKIVLDVARLDHIWRDGPMDFPDPALHRWTIDTATGGFTDEQVDDISAEFPRVADSVVGLRHRFGYMMKNAGTASIDDPMSANGAILKYDRETGAQTTIDVGRGRIPGESSFVPAADAVGEDDGYLMTFVYDAESDASEFAIFDAATMSNEPVATVELPRIPFGFHGNWVPAAVAD